MRKANLVPECWVVFVCMLSLSGCARQENPTVPVHGIVLYRGEPLRRGVIAFVGDPQRNGHQALGVGKIEADGRFTLQCEDTPGLPPGWYKVSVLSTGDQRLPEHYSDPNRSGLVCEVRPQSDNTLCIRLE